MAASDLPDHVCLPHTYIVQRLPLSNHGFKKGNDPRWWATVAHEGHPGFSGDEVLAARAANLHFPT